ASQMLYLSFGLAAVVAIALVDYRFVQQLVVPVYVLNIVMLLALYVVGHKAKGALSWFAIGPFRVQPAEFMKIGMVMALAMFFYRFDYKPQDEVYSLLRLLGSVAIAIVPIGIVLVQPDLGTALMMLFTATTIILFAR